MTAEMVDADREISRHWYLFLLTGALWIIFGFVVLSFEIVTVYAVAVFLGVGFIVGGAVEIALGAISRDGRWLYVGFGLISIVAGVVALSWPAQTFIVVAAILAWLVLFAGILDVVTGLATRHDNDIWWLQLILGALEIAVGVWAIGYSGRSVALLVLWVGVTAVFRGVSHLILAFGLRGVGRQLGAFASG